MKNNSGLTINKKVDVKTFFYQYILLLSPILKLRKQEADVFSQLLFFNYKYRDLEESLRSKIIFDYDTKTEIRYDLKNKYDEPMSYHSFYNIITSLRKKGILIDNKINPSYVVNIPEDKNYNLSFNWLIDDSEETKK